MNVIKKRWRIIKAICRSVGKGSSYFASCEAAGISQMTLWRWRAEMKNKRGITLGEILQKIWDSRVGMVEDAHFALAMRGNVQAQQNILFNRARQRWQKEPDIIVQQNNDNRTLTQVFKSAPQQIIFSDEVPANPQRVIEAVPEGCSVTSQQDLAAPEPRVASDE